MARTVFWPRCRAHLEIVFDGHGSRNDPSKKKAGTLGVDVNPQQGKVSRNGYHEADTWSLEFDARMLPFDPEMIASCSTTIYMYDSEGDDSKEWALPQYQMITGLADDWKFKLGDQQTISMSGRDYTGALDGEWDPRKMIPSGQPLDQTVQAIADAAAPRGTKAQFQVIWDVRGDDGQLLPVPITGATARSTKNKGLWVKPGKTTWEIVYELVSDHGFIVFVTMRPDISAANVQELILENAHKVATIVISSPRTQTQQSLRQAPRIMYGVNLLKLEANRKLAKEKVPQIRIVYWDAKGRQRFEVNYPEKPNQIVTGLGQKKNEYMEVGAPRYCHTRESALEFAKMRWDMLARAETEYKITTEHLKVDVDEDTEFDLLQLQAGDAIGITFDPFHRNQTFLTLDEGERAEYLIEQGFSSQVATFVASNAERLSQFQQPYYMHQADFDWDEKEGISIEITGINFANEKREASYANGDSPAIEEYGGSGGGGDGETGQGYSIPGSGGAADGED